MVIMWVESLVSFFLCLVSQKSRHLLNLWVIVQSYCIQEIVLQKNCVTVVLRFKWWVFFCFILNFYLCLGLIQYFYLGSFKIFALSLLEVVNWNQSEWLEKTIDNSFIEKESKYCLIICNINLSYQNLIVPVLI